MRIAPARPVVAPASSTEELLVEIRAEQVRQGALLERILRLLEHGRGPRDDADRRLVLAILESVGDRPFTCTDVVQHAQLADSGLRDALLGADVDTARDLGALLRRLHGITVDGVRVDRVDASRAGAVWSLRLCESDSRGLASGEDPSHD